MFCHQLGQNFVLGLDLLLQVINTALFGLVVGPRVLLEGSGSVLKEPFLPLVKHRRMQSQFLAQIRNRHFLPTDAASEWRPSLPRCSFCVVASSVLSVILTVGRSLHFQLRRDTSMRVLQCADRVPHELLQTCVGRQQCISARWHIRLWSKLRFSTSES